MPYRLRTHLDLWIQLCSPSSPVPMWIAEGYQPSWINGPPPPIAAPPPRPVAAKDCPWLENELAELVQLRVLRPLEPNEQAAWISPMAVVAHGGKRRMIVDLSSLNKYLVPAPTFKMPSVTDLSNQAGPTPRRAAKFDITKMFYHIPVHQTFQKYLVVRAPAGQLLAFQALPMGLQQSPWVATKTLAPVIHLARRMAPPSTVILQYMDDGLVEAQASEASTASDKYAATLTALGWLMSEKKCQPSPSSSIDFLGHRLTWTSDCWEATLLPSRRYQIRQHLKSAASKPLPPKRLAQLLGELAFVSPVVPLTRCLTRPLYADLHRAAPNRCWTQRPATLSTASQASLACLLEILSHHHMLSTRLVPPPPPTIAITTDASSEWGWGAVCAPPSSPDTPRAVLQDRWPSLPPALRPPSALCIAHRLAPHPNHVSLLLARIFDAHFPSAAAPPASHITALETTAALYAITAWSRNQVPMLRTDCTTTVAALVRRSSGSPPVNHLAALLEIARHALQLPRLTVVHLPGLLNIHADQASRGWMDNNGKLEWPCHRDQFLHIWHQLTAASPPPWAIDAFASTGNAQLPRFWALKPTTPMAEAIDAMAQRWSSRTLWINPPFHLMSSVVSKLVVDRPRMAVLLTPEWPHTSWWRTLARLAVASTLHHPADVVEWGPTTNLPEPLRNPKWMLRAWLIR